MEQFESRVDQAKRFAKIWWQSSADADKSQEYMALGIGVSKKTIQNWEKGVSSPDLFQSIEWFRLLAQNPLHYYLEFLYPSLFESEDCLEEGKTDEALLVLIKPASLKEKQQLL